MERRGRCKDRIRKTGLDDQRSQPLWLGAVLRDEAEGELVTTSVFVFASPLFKECGLKAARVDGARAQSLEGHAPLSCHGIYRGPEEAAFLLKQFWPDCPPHSPSGPLFPE